MLDANQLGVAATNITISNLTVAVQGTTTDARTVIVGKFTPGDLPGSIQFVSCVIPAAAVAQANVMATCTAPSLSVNAGQRWGIQNVSGSAVTDPTITYSVS